MARRRRPGLRKRGDTWHIEKFINGHRIYESTGETTYRRAEAYYDRRIQDIRQTLILGDRPEVTFREAVAKFLREDCPAKSRERAGYAFDKLLPVIGGIGASARRCACRSGGCLRACSAARERGPAWDPKRELPCRSFLRGRPSSGRSKRPGRRARRGVL